MWVMALYGSAGLYEEAGMLDRLGFIPIVTYPDLALDRDDVLPFSVISWRG